MYVKILSAAVTGIDGQIIEVEVDLASGLPQMTIVGLPDNAIREATERVRAAIRNCGFQYPLGRITVNLAPADLRKEGSAFDLAIAIGILACSGQLAHNVFDNCVVLGELSLDGKLKPVTGVLSMVHAARKLGYRRILLPHYNASEARLIDGIEVIPIDQLSCLDRNSEHFINLTNYKPHLDICSGSLVSSQSSFTNDFSDVRGQYHAKRVLMIAAAGMHNILFIGPPGSGKTMLIRRLPTIMSPLESDEALEVMKIYSVAGRWNDQSKISCERPFRAPHHTISYAGMLGGGTIPKPGEVSMAHHGILFLDEMPEFTRQVLEVLRQPLEDRYVLLSRARASLQYPTFFTLAATMNPCPCGYQGDQTDLERCRCTPLMIRRYRAKISGPLLDRIDLHIEVPRVQYKDITGASTDDLHAAYTSDQMRDRVISAQSLQRSRYDGLGVRYNSELTGRMLRLYCALSKEANHLLHQSFEALGFSVRTYDRILKIARTIADLEGLEAIETAHIAEAIQYRTLDRSV
ncbi:MAG: YifB family Mg chelatase-like AAA ATPase [Paenibacillaceae bacterium]